MDLLRSRIRTVPDFPTNGVQFQDVTPLLCDPAAFQGAIDAMAALCSELGIDRVAGIEARGFLFGAPLALRLGKPFVMVRKPNKLPGAKLSKRYGKEYGADEIQVHADCVAPGDRVLVIDDLLATGGTAEAACQLFEEAGAQIAACVFLIELGDQGGRAKLAPRVVKSVLTY